MAMATQNDFRLTGVMYAAGNGTTGAVTNNGGAYDTGLYLVTIIGGLEKNPTSGYSASGSLDYVVGGPQPLLVKSLSKSDAVFKAVTGSVYVADTQRSYAVGGSSAFQWHPDLVIGGASVGSALAIEDQYGLSNSDNDFDDYYFLVDVQQVTGDVDADSDNSSSIGEIEHSAAEEEQEDMSPGKVVAVSTAAEQVVAPLEVMLSNFSPSGSKVQFTGNSNLFHLWSENPSIPGTAVQLSFGTEYLASAAPVGFASGQWRRFYVEALAPGSGEIGVSLGPLSDGGWKEVDRVTFTGVLVDLDTDSNNDGAIDPDNDPLTGTDDPIENDPTKPGRILGINEDDDNGDGIADLTPAPPGETQVLGENDLAEVALRPLFTPDEFGTYFAKLKVSGPVKLWYASDKITAVEIDANGIASWDLAGEGPPPSIWVEGLTSGTATLEYWLDGPAGADAVPHDYVKLTVCEVDLDIDSDNEDGFAQPDGSDWEETLEDHLYGLGKLIMLDSPTRPVTPVVLRLPKNLDANDPQLRIRIDWDPVGLAGHMRLWNTAVIDAARNNNDVADGGNRLIPASAYSLWDLKYSAATGEVVIYAEGTMENSQIKTLAGVEQWGKPDERIKATLVAGGNDVASDEVKYIVANEDSFFYHLQMRQEVRNELASRGVYINDDMPEFSLKPISRAALRGLDVPEDAVKLLDEESGVPGFGAMLYQDFITGEDEYVLTFAGTDDIVDWIDNIWQGLGEDSAQYDAAMSVAFQLARNTPGIPAGNLVATGHSLGGGLASAAAVAAGIPAQTFNAAGLHLNTLDELRYPGSTARFNNAGGLIEARFVDYDLLSTVQDASPMPDAIGTRIKMDGPYDLEMTGNIARIVAGGPWEAVYGALDGASIMVDAHLHPSILYGLLVDEGEISGYDLDILGVSTYFPGE